MVIDKQVMSRMLLGVAKIWEERRDYLSDIDSQFGDGDHGVTINKIAGLIRKDLKEWTDEGIGDFIDRLGMDVMAVSGGSAGPLYGTMIGGLSEPLGDVEEIDAETLKAMFAGSLNAMQDITKAKVGDKTMMDALIPAVEAAQAADGGVEEVLLAARKAAEQGAKDSEQYISKYGRAKSYKEKTIGTPDAGAVSASLFFAGLEEGIRS